MLETGFSLETQLFSFFPTIFCAKNVTATPWNKTLSDFLIFLYVYTLYQNIIFFLETFASS